MRATPRGRPLADRVWIAPLVLTAVVAVAYFTADSVDSARVWYLVLVFGSTAGVAVGATRLPRGTRGAWYVIAAGLAMFDVAALVLAVAGWAVGPDRTALAVADLVYVAGYPVLVSGLFRLARAGGRPIRREDKIDAAIVSAAAFALVYRLVLEGIMNDSQLQPAARIATVTSPVVGVAVVFVLATSSVLTGARRPVHLLVAGAVCLMVAANCGYSVLSVRGTFSPGGVVDVGWIASSALFAAAALHPSAAERIPAGRERRVRPRVWLTMIVVAGLVPPGMILAETLGTNDTHLIVLTLVAALTVVLLVLRGGLLLAAVTSQARELEVRADTLQEVLTRRDQLEAEVRHRELHDPLTGLPNRALFVNRVEFSLAAARREQRGVAVCICDLDDFAQVNQAFGPRVGDQLLQAIARRIATSLGPGYTVARVGGDEFGVMVYASEHASSALASAERVVAVLGEPVTVGDRSFSVSTCVGVALSTCTSFVDSEALFAHAAAALSAAKEAGNGSVRLFAGDMRSRAIDRITLVNALGSALAGDQLRLRYQPTVDLRTGALVGFEALLRWQHPTLGCVPPDRFVPLAEETGYIGALGAWALWQACADAAEWPGAAGVDVAVNVSARQLRHPGFPDEVRSALAAAGLSAHRLVLEVTETALMTESEVVDEALDELRGMGVRIAVDDFGTGYSSLAQLHRLPADILKIDKSFVDPLAVQGSEGAAFITTIVRLAGHLGLQTVVEGVEQPAQCTLLRELGCDVAQGFLFGEPMPADRAAGFAASAVHPSGSRIPIARTRTPVSPVS